MAMSDPAGPVAGDSGPAMAPAAPLGVAPMVDATPAPRGYTLPVWVAAAARAALGSLLGEPVAPAVALELLEPPGVGAVPVEAAAFLGDGWALGQARCDPGEGLDLTRGLVVWVLLRWRELAPGGSAPEATAGSTPGSTKAFRAGSVLEIPAGPSPQSPLPRSFAIAASAVSVPAPAAFEPGPQDWLLIEAGEGVGIHAASREACLSAYARRLLAANLRPLVPPGQGLQLRVVLPAGRALAERTSNAAFGVVEGLALIGTRAAVQAGASPDQLEATLAALRQKVAEPGFAGDLVLVIGENGLDLAPRLGLPHQLLLKAGNWIGPVLVAAAEAGVRRLLLFGYQGKLIKLAAGIFHTHHHLADGRAEVLTAFAALEGLAGPPLQVLHGAATVEAALAELEAADSALAQRLRARLAAAVESRSAAYLARHGGGSLAVGAVLFDRSRRICAAGPIGGPLLEALTEVGAASPPAPESRV
jgi:cobalt-precorrin-5B (C1)-methyltransferase